LTQYSFLTTWLLETSREAAWEVLEDAERWPEWWRGVERVDLIDPGADGRVDTRYRIVWRSRVPYALEFDFIVRRVEPPRLMEGAALGELTGSGVWRLFEQGGVTAVLYEWKVDTTKRWMNLLAPVARPVFEYNHNVVMRRGGQGLARRLGVKLLAAG
jgi:uncharacterized protein YndB with AHSA1/START domain